ncbi:MULTISPECIES: DNA sulfur modification protein DndD [unclassified Caballeronia]|uniref:DNA sulfur modification protein DndD n=1 Tax=unclassified Caballeronia TaxID=2646786 RepID=UPI0020282C2A|nr:MULTISPECIES: DNA sulfur modification protein DndD [unclassified Caballeronia]
MLLERLTINDVGTYRGQHIIDLVPRTKYGVKRPIVLFGGLNGAGKTTLLGAVRLALYGRQSVDLSVTQKDYHAFLRGLIHAPANQLVRADRAYIELTFAYARFGERVHYRVQRSWVDRGATVDETLRVYKDGADTPLLAGEQAQAFLSQLVPEGVSQFFFFDGEKIAELANDDGNEVLADAIRRLLGLDVADRLSSDLSIYQRNRKASDMDDGVKTELAELQQRHDELIRGINEAEKSLTNEVYPQLDAKKLEMERKQAALSDRGGAWAVDRNAIVQELEELREKRTAQEALLREQLSGLAIFNLVPKLSVAVLGTLEEEHARAERAAVGRALASKIRALKAQLAKIEEIRKSKRMVDACVDNWVEAVSGDFGAGGERPLHGLTAADASRFTDAFKRGVVAGARDLFTTHHAAENILQREVELQDRLSHAPSDDSIRDAFAELQDATKAVAELEIRKRTLLESIRSQVWAAIDVTRKQKKAEMRLQQVGTSTQADVLASDIQGVLTSFKIAAAEEKCNLLRMHFVRAFKRLARKDDIVADARIDPKTFELTLSDRNGSTIPKKRLSAGEKQIFAIAMLEALAKTSGRNLPIIIDTPLGRLDSHHRSKLVESYFPVASHQVIVLSTDTEVDQMFYQGLQPYISHAYHLKYDQQLGYTSVDEGYFWKREDNAHAA